MFLSDVDQYAAPPTEDIFQLSNIWKLREDADSIKPLTIEDLISKNTSTLTSMQGADKNETSEEDGGVANLHSPPLIDLEFNNSGEYLKPMISLTSQISLLIAPPKLPVDQVINNESLPAPNEIMLAQHDTPMKTFSRPNIDQCDNSEPNHAQEEILVYQNKSLAAKSLSKGYGRQSAIEDDGEIYEELARRRLLVAKKNITPIIEDARSILKGEKEKEHIARLTGVKKDDRLLDN